MIIEEIQYYGLASKVINRVNGHRHGVYFFKECPFCNTGTRLAFDKLDVRFRVMCPHCRACTNPFYDKKKALNAEIAPAEEPG